MNLVRLFIIGLVFVQGCAAQSNLSPEMPENLEINFQKSGGMSRSYQKISINKEALEFEELTDFQKGAQKWSAAVSPEETAELYRVFVENKFDTIKNDERKEIVYDAGSESISISDGADNFFRATYGKNSPLSGLNLQRYQRVKKAIDEFVAQHQQKEMENADGQMQTRDEFEKYIQGTWRAEGKNGNYGWFLEWTFADGIFKQTGYPPILQEGKYKITGISGNKITLMLYDQKGTFGTEERSMDIVFNSPDKSLTISGTKGFSRLTSQKTN